MKIGDERAFKLLGMGAVPKLGKADITLIELKPERQVLPINEVFDFSFSLQSDSDAEQTILTYYAVAYKRPSGHITRKRYRLSQRKLKPRQRVDYENPFSVAVAQAARGRKGVSRLAPFRGGSERRCAWRF